LGIQNKEHFEEMIQKYERNNDDTHSINGSFNVDVKSEKLSIPVKIHVAHYTRSIQEIFNDNEEFLKESEETLRKYSVIMELRDEDHPCDFIPWGWKENGGLISTYANAQGNTIPVIWQDYISKEDLIHRENGLSIKKWKPLFPRYFNPLTPGKKRDKIEPKDEKILKCQNTKKCPVNPVKWDKQFFEEHWKKDVDAAPPCKIEPDK
jgi:hypothetical protein